MEESIIKNETKWAEQNKLDPISPLPVIKERKKSGRPKKQGEPLMEVFDDPPIESVGKLFRDVEKDQEALELIESLFPDGIQPRQYKGMLKTIKLILKTGGQI